MRCNQCDYPLWNLRDRRCPECGTEFLPSGRSYVPNSVRFCCTECGQDYYGTDANGHLVPTSFDCLKCGKPQTMDEMVMLPTAGVTEEQTKVFVMPWLDASFKGKPMRAWYATTGKVLACPKRLSLTIPQGASTSKAWLFGLVNVCVLSTFGIGPLLLFILKNSMGYGFGANFSTLLGVLAVCVFLFVALGLAVTLWGLIAHGVLKATGAVSGSIGRTYQAILYGSGSAFLVAIPCLGPYLLWPIALIWWTIVAGIMLATIQKVHWLRATIASIVMPFLVVGTVVGAITFLMTMAFSAAGGVGAITSAATMSTVISETQLITDGLSMYRVDTGTDGPKHALGLLVDDYLLSGNDFVGSSTSTIGSDTMLPGTLSSGTVPSLRSIDEMSNDEIVSLVASSAANLPADVIAHRLGDYVFTYHGVPAAANNAQLWVVIYWPDPDVNNAPQPYEWMMAGQADGTVVPISPQMMTPMLSVQNDLRQAAGLPPLPEPRTVTHSSPASGK